MKTILVQMSDRQWTQRALHVACAMARYDSAKIVLLRMIEAQHYSWLGTDFGYTPLTQEESSALWEYKATAEDYGIELEIEPMQWVTYTDALVDAAAALEAQTVFADVPHSIIPVWRKIQTWELRRQLHKHGIVLHTLEQPVQGIANPELETAGHHA